MTALVSRSMRFRSNRSRMSRSSWTSISSSRSRHISTAIASELAYFRATGISDRDQGTPIIGLAASQLFGHRRPEGDLAVVRPDAQVCLDQRKLFALFVVLAVVKRLRLMAACGSRSSSIINPRRGSGTVPITASTTGANVLYGTGSPLMTRWILPPRR
jgi:hypothetical protein